MLVIPAHTLETVPVGRIHQVEQGFHLRVEGCIGVVVPRIPGDGRHALPATRPHVRVAYGGEGQNEVLLAGEVAVHRVDVGLNAGEGRFGVDVLQLEGVEPVNSRIAHAQVLEDAAVIKQSHVFPFGFQVIDENP